MYTVNDLSKRFGDTLLFERVNFTINPGDRIGLVGPNGTGKSTLLRILAGEEQQDSGSLTLAPGNRVGYLRQGFADIPDGTLADLSDIPTGGLLSAQGELDAAADGLAVPHADIASAAERFQRATDEFDALGGYDAIDAIAALLDRFGLGQIPLERPLVSLSGGQKTRVGLAALLASRPDILVLDEPTNHLDGEALGWLTGFLNDYAGAVLVVSHDRGFLDNVVNRIIAFERDSRTTKDYPGNYSDYVAAKQHEEDEAEAAWKRQQSDIERMTRDIRAAENKARTIEGNTIDYAIRKKAAKIARPAVVRKRKLERLLEGEDAAEKPVRHWSMSLDFGGTVDGARNVATLTDVNVAFGDHRVLQDIDLEIHRGDRIALTGANGSGKTTLMRLISGELDPDSGSVRLGPGVRAGYFSQEQQTLDPAKTIVAQARSVAILSESDTRTFLHKFLFGGDMVHRLVGDLSYGERARLMLALLVLRETTLLMLDEPLNHLDIESREEFEQALSNYNGTIMMVSHDRYMVDRFATRVIELRHGLLHERTSEVSRSG